METQLYKVFQFLGTRIIGCFPTQPLELYHEEKAGKNVSPRTLIHPPTIFNSLSNNSSQNIHKDKIQPTLPKDFPKVQIFRLHRLHYSDSPSTLFWH